MNDRQIDRQIDRYTDTQIDRQIDRLSAVFLKLYDPVQNPANITCSKSHNRNTAKRCEIFSS